MIRDNLIRLREKISDICQRIGRDPAEITLVGATKYAQTESIKEAIEAGLEHIGENRVQDAQKKLPALEGLDQPVTRHMIGHLQTNKAKVAVQLFDLIQTVDSLKLARELDKQARKQNTTVDILIQVNTSGEQQKYGITPEATLVLVEELQDLETLRLKGFMTMAPFSEDTTIIRDSFRELRRLRDRVQESFGESEAVRMRYLSMGMSHDFEIALEEGANMLRIGRAIFHDE